MQKKKRETVEDFVGWKSEDGLLEVVDIVGRDIKQKKTLFKVICHKCKEDKELFPEGYFVGIKYNLNKGQKPCGCSKKHNWNEWQFLLLASRAAKDRFIVHGYSEEFHGQRTKVNLECLKDGYKWTANLSNIINHGKGCPKCKARPKITEQEALDKCKAICETEGYEPIGFVDNYKNNSSIFEYKCSIHGKQSVSYNNLAQGRRCIGCWKERQKELSSGFYGYYPEKKDEQDYLYVLDFDGKYIKIGRSFDVDERIKDLKKPKNSGIKKIYKLRIFTATHQEIYDLEQELHSELRERNFQHYVDWSTECFTSDSLPFLNMLLDKCGFEEVKL